MRYKLGRLLATFVIICASAFPVTANAATSSLGTNIISNGTVYTILKDGKKTVRRPYTSSGAFLSYKFNDWSNVVQATAEDLELPVGDFIPPRDGKVMCSDRGVDKGTCYLITDSKKAGFVSESAMYQYQFNYDKALHGDLSFLETVAPVQTGLEKHLPGTVINWNDKLYLITRAGLKSIANKTVLYSWGYWDDNIVYANEADWKFAKNGKLSTRGKTTIRPDLGGSDDTKTKTLKIETTSLPNAKAWEPYSHRLKASGGAAPYRWQTISTDYPSGCCILGLAGSSGNESDYYGNYDPVYFNTQSGDYVLPDHIGTYTWKIQVTDANGLTATRTLKLTIEE